MTFNDFKTVFTLYVDGVKTPNNPSLSRSKIAKATLATILTKDSELINFLHFSAGYMCRKDPKRDVSSMLDEVFEHFRNETEMFRLINSFDESCSSAHTIH